MSADGFVPLTLALVSTRGRGREHEIALAAGARLAGIVVRAGKPVAGATVVLHEGDVPLSVERRTTMSDDAGAFAFEALPACEATVHARASDGVSPVTIVRCDGSRAPEPITLELGPGWAVSGRVVARGLPVAGARVSLRDSLEGPDEIPLIGGAVSTGGDGRFRLGPLAPASQGLRVLWLRAVADGFAPIRMAVATGVEPEIVLSRAAGLVVSVGVGDARVEVRDSGGALHVLEPGESQAPFEHSALDLAPGSAWVVARAPGKAAAERRVELLEGATTRLELDPGAGRKLEGQCAGDDGSVLAGVSIALLDPAAGPLGPCAFAVSGEDGRFSIDHAPEGKLSLVATLAGYVEGRTEVDAGATTVAVQLARSYALEVQLSGPSGVIPRAFIQLSPLDGRGERVEKVIGGARTVLERLVGARYRLEAISPGLAPSRTDVDPREESQVTLALGAGARADGVVVGPDGSALPGSSIVLGNDPDEDLGHPGTFAKLLAMTDQNGAFSAALSPEGESVVVTRPGFAPLLLLLAPGAGQRIQLAPGGRIDGRALARDGSPQPGVGIALEGPLAKHGSSGADGSFSFSGLLPGHYKLRRHDAPEESAPVQVTVGDQGASSVDMRAP